jgi:hypothetical protein
MKLTKSEKESLLQTLESRFKKNSNLHKNTEWKNVEARLLKSDRLRSLYEMEQTGGEPDVIGQDKNTGHIIYCDCSAESPADRRSLCYDREALDSRKENKPANSAMDMAEEMGIELLSEDEYRDLQKLGKFDTKTSSWIKTPQEVRKLGGALFADFRYGRVFVYHNSAPSYYAARGFRGLVRI